MARNGARSGNGDNSNPRVVFGVMLRHYRAQAGLSQEQLGGLVYLTGDMVAKIERGQRTASEKFVDDCEALPELAACGSLRVLWEQLRESFTSRPYPGWFADWPGKEAQAVKLRWFEMAVVPGLLQTESYARALLTDRIAFRGDIDEAVAARMERAAILDRDDPPELWVVVDEAVLHRPVGGPDVMAGQLKHLIEMASRPTVVIRVIPATVGVHDGLPGAGFITADFGDGTPPVAYQDTAVQGQVIEDAEDITVLSATWDRLAAEALPRSASLARMEEVGRSWTT